MHSVGVVTQITATLRLTFRVVQYSLFDFSCKLSPFRAGLLTELGNREQGIGTRFFPKLNSKIRITNSLLLLMTHFWEKLQPS
jgi:hypothetical protein